jgi:hypothetical protein
VSIAKYEISIKLDKPFDEGHTDGMIKSALAQTTLELGATVPRYVTTPKI